MKKLPFLIIALVFCLFEVRAQTTTRNRGAANFQELGQAVFSSLQENRFSNLHQYLPEANELKILKRRSSEDMQLVLEKTGPDSIKDGLGRDFNTIEEHAQGLTLNWNDWQVAETKASRRDRKNPLLYRLETTLSNATGGRQLLVYEAIRIRGRYFLFRHMKFEAKP